MSLTADDYESVRKHLRYPYSDLSAITDVLNDLANQYGADWVTELQMLLSDLATADQTLTNEAAIAQPNEFQLEGAYRVYYPDNSNPLLSANLAYNKLISELVLLTGITVNGVSTRIYRG